MERRSLPLKDLQKGMIYVCALGVFRLENIRFDAYYWLNSRERNLEKPKADPWRLTWRYVGTRGPAYLHEGKYEDGRELAVYDVGDIPWDWALAFLEEEHKEQAEAELARFAGQVSVIGAQLSSMVPMVKILRAAFEEFQPE